MSRYNLGPKEFLASAGAMSHQWSQPEALEYTCWLATHHYENFHIASFLLPRRLHQDFHNVYGFCRWADDLGDEIGDTRESLRLLAWWRDQLREMYAGRAKHPVFVALRGTAERYSLPVAPFADLITAFEQDQTVTRYRTWDELFGYCGNSANPVGRLVLYLCGYSDSERQALSDATCTALQMANFWQDVTVDLAKGRVYIPLEVMDRHGYTLADLEACRFTPPFRLVMRDIVEVARGLFHQGLALVDTVDRRLAIDLDLFSHGGLRVLEKIEAQDYNVLARRPAVSKVERVGLLLGAIARRAFSRAAA